MPFVLLQSLGKTVFTIRQGPLLLRIMLFSGFLSILLSLLLINFRVGRSEHLIDLLMCGSTHNRAEPLTLVKIITWLDGLLSRWLWMARIKLIQIVTHHKTLLLLAWFLKERVYTMVGYRGSRYEGASILTTTHAIRIYTIARIILVMANRCVVCSDVL